MSKTKSAKLICKSIELICGYCDETIEEPKTGSLFWVLTELESKAKITCNGCGNENKITIPIRVATSQ